VHFLVTCLSVRIVYAIVIVKDQQTIDYIRGFDDLGGVHDFKTEILEHRLARSGVIKVEKPKMEQPEVVDPKSAFLAQIFKPIYLVEATLRHEKKRIWYSLLLRGVFELLCFSRYPLLVLISSSILFFNGFLYFILRG
ncbi:hypothetical protein OESDEN_10185, partial [Oesophagostomum dentatum]